MSPEIPEKQSKYKILDIPKLEIDEQLIVVRGNVHQHRIQNATTEATE
jgi:hypothetical protein